MKLLHFKKPDTHEAQVQEFINHLASLQPQKDDFDHKAWKWSTVIFYILLIGIISGIFVWKEAKACYGTEDETPVVIKVDNL